MNDKSWHLSEHIYQKITKIDLYPFNHILLLLINFVNYIFEQRNILKQKKYYV